MKISSELQHDGRSYNGGQFTMDERAIQEENVPKLFCGTVGNFHSCPYGEVFFFSI